MTIGKGEGSLLTVLDTTAQSIYSVFNGIIIFVVLCLSLVLIGAVVYSAKRKSFFTTFYFVITIALSVCMLALFMFHLLTI